MKVFVQLGILCFCLHGGSQLLAQRPFPDEITQKLDTAFAVFSDRPHVENAVARIDAFGGKRVWARAKGPGTITDDQPFGSSMTVELQLRTAGISKTMTAAIIMQLSEEGALHLDEEVHGKCTIRQLLNHTSGLADYRFDKGSVGSWNGRSWLDVMIAEAFDEEPEVFDPPTRIWDPGEIVQFYREIGLDRAPHFAPGEDYFYCETNYVLLGILIERRTGISLAENYRRRIFRKIGMDHTYTEHREPPTPGGKLANHYWYLRNTNVNVIDRQMASSGEWANGGHVSTVADLSAFIRGLFKGQFFLFPQSTLERMLNLSTLELKQPRTNFDQGQTTYDRYSGGLMHWNIDGIEVWGHTGFWGIGMFYIPQADVSLTFSRNQVEGDMDDDLRLFMQAIRESNLLD